MKRWIYLALAMAMLLFSGCAKQAAQQPLILEKSLTALTNAATGEVTDGAVNAAEPASLRERVQAPERVRASLASPDGGLEVQVDARIVLPVAAQLPIAKVERLQIDEAMVQRAYTALMGEAVPLPEQFESTKASFRRSIEWLYAQRDSGQLDKYETMEELEAAIREAEQELSTLPDEFVQGTLDLRFRDAGVFARAARDNETVSVFEASHSHIEYVRDSYFIAMLSNLDQSWGEGMLQYKDSPQFRAPAIQQSAALALVQAAMREAGLQDYTLAEEHVNVLYHPQVPVPGGVRQGVYEFLFTRQVNGVQVTYEDKQPSALAGGSVTWQTPAPGNNVVEEPEVLLPWLYECLHVIVDDEGILYLKWISPYAVREIVAGDASLLSFAQIQPIMERALVMVNDAGNVGADGGYTRRISIGEVRLGLMRITEPTQRSNGMLVPVWDFFGTAAGQDGYVEGQGGHRSFLTINAIDGSILDRTKGY